jgi:transposase
VRVFPDVLCLIEPLYLVRFMLYAGKFDAFVMISFLERLIEGRERKLYWIVDRHPVHRAQAVKDWLATHTEPIELVFLPSYSPHLNPVEYLNGDVKQGVHSKPPSRNFEQLKQRILNHLHKLQQLPTRVKSYFQHPDIAYAAYLYALSINAGLIGENHPTTQTGIQNFLNLLQQATAAWQTAQLSDHPLTQTAL